MPDQGSRPDFDVLVVGGGPAGSTVSTFLQRMGWRVGLVEKDRHPRFHIGESLLPWNVPIFDRLGVLAEVQKIGVPKLAADFSLPHSAEFVRVDFSKAMRPTPPLAFQVRRAELDDLLLRTSAGSGVIVVEGARAIGVDLDDGSHVRLDVEDSSGARFSWTGRFLIDASGRDTLLGRSLGIKQRHPKHKSAALYGHFEGVERREGRDSGNISIYWFPNGWIWMIPLTGGVTSVGVVAHPGYFQNRGDVAGALEDALGACLPARIRMSRASLLGELTSTGNYSYSCERMYGQRYLLVGDAFAFVDPVFSSGVYIAMSTAETAAAAVGAWLSDPAAGLRAFARLERRIRRGINRFWWFIDRFNEPALQGLFMKPVNFLGVRTAVLSTLAGDVFGNWRLSLPLVIFRMMYKIKSRMLPGGPGTAKGVCHEASARKLQV